MFQKYLATKLFSMDLINIRILSNLLVILTCCTSQSDEQASSNLSDSELNLPFNEETALDSYLNNVLDSDTPDTLFYIPISSCESCVKKTFKLLKNNAYSNIIIIGGDTTQYTQYRDEITWHKLNSILLFDSNYMANRYNLEIFGVTAIYRDQNSLLRYSNISWQNIHDFAKSFGWNYNVK